MTAAIPFADTDVDVASSNSPIGVVAVATMAGKAAAVCIGQRSLRQATKSLDESVKLLSADPRSGALVNEQYGSTADLSAGEVLEAILQYTDGEMIDLSRFPVWDQYRTQFQRDVSAACRSIPYGETRTYGQLAAEAGRPGAARAVGRVMSTNCVPLLTPCHRVVGSAGQLGGFSAPQGVKLKRQLLDLEQAALGE